jgi:hypothetical protein
MRHKGIFDIQLIAPMKSIHLVAALLISLSILNVQGTEVVFDSPNLPSSNQERKTFQVAPVSSSAVDSSGIWHRSDGGRKSMVWLNDVASAPVPDYSEADRVQRREGFGLFHLTLDLGTGVVREVTIRKSTGLPTLDGYGVASLRQWRWKPKKWKEVDIPIFMSAFRWVPATSLRTRHAR